MWSADHLLDETCAVWREVTSGDPYGGNDRGPNLAAEGVPCSIRPAAMTADRRPDRNPSALGDQVLFALGADVRPGDRLAFDPGPEGRTAEPLEVVNVPHATGQRLLVAYCKATQWRAPDADRLVG